MKDYIENVGELEKKLNDLPESTPVIVDFDHTLYLGNSTEVFISSIRPRLIAALLLYAMALLRPWLFFSGESKEQKGYLYRDSIRVGLLSQLFFWSKDAWQKREARLAAKLFNTQLVTLLSQRNHRLILASNGYDFVINELLKYCPLQFETVIAARIGKGHEFRMKGKWHYLKNYLGEESYKGAMLITDSVDDAPLLDEVDYPMLIVWPDAVHRRAFDDLYLPFFYLEFVKRPNRNEFIKQVLLDDIPVLLLAISIVNPLAWWNLAALLCAFVAFFCVYEIGYYENDLMGEKFEDSPNLGDDFKKYKDYRITPDAWIWAVGLSILASFLLHWPDLFRDTDLNSQTLSDAAFGAGPVVTFLALLGLLLLLRATYWIYNRTDEFNRIYTFPLLQIQKTFGFCLLLPTSMAGALFMFAQVNRRWVAYIIYRCGGDKTILPNHTIRIATFVFGSIMVMLAEQSWSLICSWQYWLIMVWILARGANHVKQTIQMVRDNRLTLR